MILVSWSCLYQQVGTWTGSSFKATDKREISHWHPQSPTEFLQSHTEDMPTHLRAHTPRTICLEERLRSAPSNFDVHRWWVDDSPWFVHAWLQNRLRYNSVVVAFRVLLQDCLELGRPEMRASTTLLWQDLRFPMLTLLCRTLWKSPQCKHLKFSSPYIFDMN